MSSSQPGQPGQPGQHESANAGDVIVALRFYALETLPSKAINLFPTIDPADQDSVYMIRDVNRDLVYIRNQHHWLMVHVLYKQTAKVLNAGLSEVYGEREIPYRQDLRRPYTFDEFWKPFDALVACIDRGDTQLGDIQRRLFVSLITGYGFFHRALIERKVWDVNHLAFRFHCDRSLDRDDADEAMKLSEYFSKQWYNNVHMSWMQCGRGDHGTELQLAYPHFIGKLKKNEKRLPLIGYLAYRPCQGLSMMRIFDLFVLHEFRNLGIASIMLLRAARSVGTQFIIEVTVDFKALDLCAMLRKVGFYRLDELGNADTANVGHYSFRINAGKLVQNLESKYIESDKRADQH